MARPALLLEIGVVLCLAWLPHLVNAHFADPAADRAFFGGMVLLAVVSVQIAVPLLYIMHRSGEPWSKFGVVRPRPVDLVGGAVLLGALYVLDPVFWVFIGTFGTWDPPRTSFPDPSSVADFVILLPAILVAAFAEELAMRAYMIPRLRELGLNWVSALLISSAFFASYHLYQGAASTAYIFLLGLVYGAVFLLSPRLWPLTVAHTMQNVLINLGA
ncbi:MAG: CPBP family intramembrane metalloprotease [Planctomycetes bacterium]|nr:CPBP family intramembrane metalloprotease [Planctomycetota bacterium]